MRIVLLLRSIPVGVCSTGGWCMEGNTMVAGFGQSGITKCKKMS